MAECCKGLAPESECECAKPRIAELEAVLAETYGHVLDGSATTISRNNMLHKIRTALRWPDVEIAARRAADALHKWAQT